MQEEFYRGFDSACGLHINTLATDDYLYVPTFGDDPNRQSVDLDNRVLQAMRSSGTSKRIVPVPIPYEVCRMGGNVRCLSWQVKGDVAIKLVNAARRSAGTVSQGCGVA